MLLWLALQAAPELGEAMTRYREQTSVTIDCRERRGDDIIICSRRDADRWRVPLIALDPADPANQSVATERDRLLARTNNCQEKSTFLVGCGMAGVSASTRSGVSLIGERPIAP